MNINSEDYIVDDFTTVWAVAVVIISGLIFIILIYLGYEGKAKAALISSIVILTSIRIFWPLRSKIWYRVTIGCIIGVHLVAIILGPWPNEGFSGIRLAPFMVLDIVVVVTLIVFLNKIMKSR